jgi:hypothetical protein
MTNFNITKFGHFDNEINSDEKYLLDLLSRKYTVSFSKQINLNHINILFEGHQKINHKNLIEELKKCNKKRILVMTEDLVGEDNINFKYFTFNSDKFSYKKFIKKKNIKYDLFLDFFIYHMKKFIFFNIFIRLFSKIKFLQEENIYELRHYWRERYYILIDQLNYIDEVWFLRENNLNFYKDILKFKNIKNRIIFYRIINLSKKNLNKNIDILVTGTLNPYRKSIVDRLSKQFKVEYHSHLKTSDLEKKLKESKFYLILNKSHYGIFPSSSRMKISLENDCIPLNQKTVFNDYLNIYSYKIDNFDKHKFQQIIENYHDIYEKIFTNLKSAMQKKNYFKFLEDL